MKKIAWIAALALVLALGLAGCANAYLGVPLNERTDNAPAAEAEAREETEDAARVSWSGPSHLTMDSWLLTEGGISIRAVGFCRDAAGDGYLRLYLNNNTVDDIRVTCQVYVNGQAVDIPFDHEVKALEGLDCDLFLVVEDLVAQGIDQVQELAAVFTVESEGRLVLESDRLVIDLAAL